VLRFRDIKDAKAAGQYYGKSDGGYYLDGADLHREVGGKAAQLLGLEKAADFEQFKRLLQGLDPHSGEQLTAKLMDGRIAGWDVTASIPKGVTVALERGDGRIHDAIWDAGREAMADLEGLVTTRMKGGRDGEKVTGNMIWYGFEHPETRPAKQDGMPDPDRHIHFVIPNVTWSEDAEQWQSIRFRPIMDLRKYFSHRFDMRLASKLSDLGYEIETKQKSDGQGGKRYYSWDIQGLPQSVITKFSRRTLEVEKLAAELGVDDAVSKDKLGATSREEKREDMTLAGYRRYWDSRVTKEEDRQIQGAIERARLGKNVQPANAVAKAMQYAIEHQFYRNSVVPWHQLANTAMERSMGAGLPEELDPEARRQGVLLKNGEATTREVLQEEAAILRIARERGTMRPLAPLSHGKRPDTGELSPEQRAAVGHVWESPDRLILIRGGAGTGKTHMMRTAIAGIDRPVVVLAPSSDASRGVLRREGFKDANTVASFLGSEDAQQRAKNGVIWIDEVGLLPIKDLRQVLDVAGQVNARVVLQGDPKQHKSPSRHGNMFHVLQHYAGLPVAELKDIRRQTGDFKAAVAAIDRGDLLQGHDLLAKLGWIKQTPAFNHNRALVDEYMAGVEAGRSVLVVAPTHKEGEEISAEIRKRLKAEARLGKEEREFQQLKALHWTEAERGDWAGYSGNEVIQFYRNNGTFKAGTRVRVSDLEDRSRLSTAKHFAVYIPSSIAVSPGDSLRITANGWDKTKMHRIDNGSVFAVAGFTPSGDIRLQNGWIIDKGFGHLNHAYVSTSHASQGKTVDRVLVAMGHESRAAVNAEQFYVSVSRARESARIFSDLSAATLRQAIQRVDDRKSATELMYTEQPQQKAKLRDRGRAFVARVQEVYRRLRERAVGGIENLGRQERGLAYER